MGWRGTLRSLNALQRASVEKSHRRERAELRRLQNEEKARDLQHARTMAEKHEEYLKTLVSYHLFAPNVINWNAIVQARMPNKPSFLKTKEVQARCARDDFKPGFFVRLLRQERKKIRKLDDAITRAISEDYAMYQSSIEKWHNATAKLKKMKSLAEGVLKNDNKSKISALKSRGVLNSIREVEVHTVFEVIEGTGLVHATINISDDSIIPRKANSLLASGKLSKRKIPLSLLHSTYQDHVCSLSLRAAKEVAVTIFDNHFIVTMEVDRIDSKSGHVRPMAILSTKYERNTLDSLNFHQLDPSDAMENFDHKMDFLKTKGFREINPIDISFLKGLP